MRCDEMGVLSLGMEWEEDYPVGLYLARKRIGKGTWYINAIRCRLLRYLTYIIALVLYLLQLGSLG